MNVCLTTENKFEINKNSIRDVLISFGNKKCRRLDVEGGGLYPSIFKSRFSTLFYSSQPTFLLQILQFFCISIPIKAVQKPPQGDYIIPPCRFHA